MVSRAVDEWQGGGGKNLGVLTYMNKASRSKVQCLFDILQHAHYRADNLKPLQCEHQRRRACYDSRVLRQAHHGQRASRPQEARRTLVPPAAWPSWQSRRAHRTLSAPLPPPHNVLARSKVDTCLGAESLAQVSLLVAAVDGNHTHAHRLGILHREVAEPTSGAGEDNPFARLDGASLARSVYCDSTAHYGARLFISDALRDPRRVLAVCNAVLLDLHTSASR
jgi:hypothetical protein